MQRILVTGGAGFIGSHTVQQLLKEKCRVTVLDNLSTGKMSYLPLMHADLQFVRGDVRDYPLLSRLVASNDVVLHLAAIASVQASMQDPAQTTLVNTQGFLQVLQAIKEANRSIRLVYASSAAIYGNVTELPCQEAFSFACPPLSPYALQKRHMEEYATLFHKLYNIPSLGLRYFNVYGARQDPQSPYSGVISRFMAAYQEQAPLTVFGDGQQSRDFIYIDDIVKANLLALQSDYQGALNIATGQPKTLRQLIHYIEKTEDRPANVAFLPAKTGDIAHSYGATEMAKTHLGFVANTSLEHGIRDLAFNLSSQAK